MGSLKAAAINCRQKNGAITGAKYFSSGELSRRKSLNHGLQEQAVVK